MTPLLATALVLAAASTAALNIGSPRDGGGARAPCVKVWAEARYAALGYDHVVHLANRCREASACSVATNVNPDPQMVTVAPEQNVEVVTWKGSPAAEFSPQVSCAP